MAMPRTLLVARLWYEGNRFSPQATDRAAFERFEWQRGDAALADARGRDTELAAVAEFAARHDGWRVVVSRCAAAWPGGPIDDALFDALVDELLNDLRLHAPDAAYLSLHGAAITLNHDAPESLLLQRFRSALGGRPMVASFDLHANADPHWVHLLDFASAYRTHPHVDLRATAARVLARLDALCAGERLHGHVAKLGLRLASQHMRTDAGPMAALQARARALEAAHAQSEVVLFGGFPYADTPFADACVMAWAPDAATARRLAETLRDAWRACASDFDVVLPSPIMALQQAQALLPDPSGRLVTLTDPADNPLSGGGADTTGLLRALLHWRAHDAVAAALPGVAFAYFCDPGLARRARDAGVGASLVVALGARHGPQFGAAVQGSATVRHLAGGRFVNCGPMLGGQTVDAGATALLDLMGVAIVVTSNVVPADDPAFYAMAGIDLAQLRLLCVKAKNHFHAAFAPRCAAIIATDAPGPAMADPSQLPSRHWPPPSPASPPA